MCSFISKSIVMFLLFFDTLRHSTKIHVIDKRNLFCNDSLYLFSDFGIFVFMFGCWWCFLCRSFVSFSIYFSLRFLFFVDFQETENNFTSIFAFCRCHLNELVYFEVRLIHSNPQHTKIEAKNWKTKWWNLNFNSIFRFWTFRFSIILSFSVWTFIFHSLLHKVHSHADTQTRKLRNKQTRITNTLVLFHTTRSLFIGSMMEFRFTWNTFSFLSRCVLFIRSHNFVVSPGAHNTWSHAMRIKPKRNERKQKNRMNIKCKTKKKNTKWKRREENKI